MRFLPLIVGTIALIVGGIWIGQGTGCFPYPGSSFMINDITWAYVGAGVVAGGFLLIYLARRSAAPSRFVSAVGLTAPRANSASGVFGPELRPPWFGQRPLARALR